MKAISLAQKYKNKKLREVTLEGGEVVTVRALTREDFLAVGTIPAVLAPVKEIKEIQEAEEGGRVEDAKLALTAEIKRNLSFYEKLVRHTVTNCIVTKDFRVVDKPAGTEAEGELPLSLLSDEDASRIYAGVMAASGTLEGKEAVAGAALFLSQPGATPIVGPDGPALPLPSK